MPAPGEPTRATVDSRGVGRCRRGGQRGGEPGQLGGPAPGARRAGVGEVLAGVARPGDVDDRPRRAGAGGRGHRRHSRRGRRRPSVGCPSLGLGRPALGAGQCRLRHHDEARRPVIGAQQANRPPVPAAGVACRRGAGRRTDGRPRDGVPHTRVLAHDVCWWCRDRIGLGQRYRGGEAAEAAGGGPVGPRRRLGPGGLDRVEEEVARGAVVVGRLVHRAVGRPARSAGGSSASICTVTARPGPWRCPPSAAPLACSAFTNA